MDSSDLSTFGIFRGFFQNGSSVITTLRTFKGHGSCDTFTGRCSCQDQPYWGSLGSHGFVSGFHTLQVESFKVKG